MNQFPIPLCALSETVIDAASSIYDRRGPVDLTVCVPSGGLAEGEYEGPTGPLQIRHDSSLNGQIRVEAPSRLVAYLDDVAVESIACDPPTPPEGKRFTFERDTKPDIYFFDLVEKA